MQIKQDTSLRQLTQLLSFQHMMYELLFLLLVFSVFFLIRNRVFCLLAAVSLSGKSYHFWHLQIPISEPHITYYIFKLGIHKDTNEFNLLFAGVWLLTSTSATRFVQIELTICYIIPSEISFQWVLFSCRALLYTNFHVDAILFFKIAF